MGTDPRLRNILEGYDPTGNVGALSSKSVEDGVIKVMCQLCWKEKYAPKLGWLEKTSAVMETTEAFCTDNLTGDYYDLENDDHASCHVIKGENLFARIERTTTVGINGD